MLFSVVAAPISVPTSGAPAFPLLYILANTCCFSSDSLSFLFLAVLCAERVGQMTKTYNDIDAVTRLLEEVSVLREGKGCLKLTL